MIDTLGARLELCQPSLAFSMVHWTEWIVFTQAYLAQKALLPSRYVSRLMLRRTMLTAPEFRSLVLQ
jgi:hypothetical protein